MPKSKPTAEWTCPKHLADARVDEHEAARLLHAAVVEAMRLARVAGRSTVVRVWVVEEGAGNEGTYGPAGRKGTCQA